jgi:hypothetical protein
VISQPGMLQPAGNIGSWCHPDGAVKLPVICRLCCHLRDHGTAPDGRPFRGTRGGVLSESVYGRAWHAARQAALGPDLAATALAHRLYDLRHAALSLWPNASGAPAEVAARAGTSARVLHDVYLHCTDSQEDQVSQWIEAALDAGTGRSRPPPCVKRAVARTVGSRGPSPLYVRARGFPAAGTHGQPRTPSAQRAPDAYWAERAARPWH